MFPFFLQCPVNPPTFAEVHTTLLIIIFSFISPFSSFGPQDDLLWAVGCGGWVCAGRLVWCRAAGHNDVMCQCLSVIRWEMGSSAGWRLRLYSAGLTVCLELWAMGEGRDFLYCVCSLAVLTLWREARFGLTRFGTCV